MISDMWNAVWLWRLLKLLKCFRMQIKICSKKKLQLLTFSRLELYGPEVARNIGKTSGIPNYINIDHFTKLKKKYFDYSLFYHAN